VAKQAAQLYY